MSLYNISVKDANHVKTDLSPYKGKVLLIINSATKCGHTKQYKALQALYEKYQDKGFEILDFPSNQFLGQAPGSIENIKKFCELNFGTTFPLFEKIRVNGFFAHPLYRYLKSNAPKELAPGEKEAEESADTKARRIKWNFTKFLIDRDGQIRYRFAPAFLPEDIDAYIQKLI